MRYVIDILVNTPRTRLFARDSDGEVREWAGPECTKSAHEAVLRALLSELNRPVAPNASAIEFRCCQDSVTKALASGGGFGHAELVDAVKRELARRPEITVAYVAKSDASIRDARRSFGLPT